MNKFLLRSAITGALGGLLFGFDTSVIAGTTHALKEHFGLSSIQLGFTVSIALWGTVLGAICAGSIGQRLGGRGALRVMALLYVISAIGCAFAWNWQSFLTARFLGGLGIGGSSVLGPVYIAELAPPQSRGRLVGLFQVNIVVGILLAYLSNFYIASLSLKAMEWRWDLGISAAPALLFLLMLFGIPHSPRWLATQGRLYEAQKTLAMLGAPRPEHELEAIMTSIFLVARGHAESLFKWRYRVPILLAVSLAIFSQLSGINAVLYYLNDIFVSAGFSRISGAMQAVVVGAANLMATLLAMALIDKIGRRLLLLIGCVGMAIGLSGIAFVFISGRWHNILIYFVMSYTAFFALSSGSVLWVYMSEIFPTAIRAKGQAVGSTALWITNGIVSLVFPIMAQHFSYLPFLVFAGVMVVQFMVTLFYFPETKGLSLEDVQVKLGLGDT